MGGEDFSYFQQKVPGAFLFFGAGDGQEFPHHHPAFNIDEKALPQAVLLLLALPFRAVSQNKPITIGLLLPDPSHTDIVAAAEFGWSTGQYGIISG